MQTDDIRSRAAAQEAAASSAATDTAALRIADAMEQIAAAVDQMTGLLQALVEGAPSSREGAFGPPDEEPAEADLADVQEYCDNCGSPSHPHCDPVDDQEPFSTRVLPDPTLDDVPF